MQWVIYRDTGNPNSKFHVHSINEDTYYEGALSIGTEFQTEKGEDESVLEVVFVFPQDVADSISELDNLLAAVRYLVGDIMPGHLVEDRNTPSDIAFLFFSTLAGVFSSAIEFAESKKSTV
jgi:hypothetical protein